LALLLTIPSLLTSSHQCADVRFTADPFSQNELPALCKNSTGIQVDWNTGGNANGTQAATDDNSSNNDSNNNSNNNNNNNSE